MRFETTTQSAEKIKTDLLVLPLCSDEKNLPAEAKEINSALAGRIKEIAAGKDFSGDSGETMLLYAPSGIAAKRLVLAGLGKKDKLDSDALRTAAAAAANIAAKNGARDITFIRRKVKGVSPELFGRALAEGAIIGPHKLTRHKTDSKKTFAPATIRAACGRAEAGAIKDGGEYGIIAARCANLARDLVTQPANVATPSYLAAAAKKIAKQYRMKCKIFSRSDMAKMKMGALLSVALGADTPPKFIVVEHNPPGAKETVVVIGKGITFDSGGINLKPSTGIAGMKGDMGGGAAALAIIAGVGEMKLKKRVICLVPATENMPGGHATRPSDIVKSMKGKTIEILNTDAEGRMALADALTFAERYKPDAVFDFATLTGACSVALGSLHTGLFGNDGKLISLVEKAAVDSGERVWHLPMIEEHVEMMKSDIADIKNISGGRGAGASTAAGFLSNFADEFRWVHLDIAGTSETEKTKYFAKGATGAPVRLMLNLLKNFSVK